jgi:acyl-CoA synthetase (NDP forming)
LPAQPESLGERRSKECLAAYGIPVAKEIFVAADALDSLSAARFDLRFPVVVKVESSDLPHKTEAGAVALGLADLAAARAAAGRVIASARAYAPQARIEGVTIAEMQTGLETIVGAVCDPYFGPVVMFGLGGIATELLQEVSYRFAPFDQHTARTMIESLKIAPLFRGYRGRPALDIDALSDLLARVSCLIADHADRIAEIDVNPVFVRAEGEGACAADALVVMRR